MSKHKTTEPFNPVMKKRNLKTDRLDETGAESLDPVPHAVTIGVRPQPSMDERIRQMLRQNYIEQNPDFGLESDDDEDFNETPNDPMYDFEKRYEEIEELRSEMARHEAELEAAKEEYKAKRKAAAKPNTDEPKPQPKKDAKAEKDGPKDD